MLRVTTYLTGIYLCLSLTLSAQNETRSGPTNTLSIQLGAKIGWLKDENLSMLNYRDRAITYQLAYEKRISPTGRQFLTSLEFSNGEIRTPPYDFFNTDYIQARLNLAWLWPVLNRHSKDDVSLFFGGGYALDFNYLEWYESEFGDQDAFSFLVAHSVMAHIKAEQKIGERQQISGVLATPLYTLLVRPPYSGFDEELVENNESNPFRLITNGEWGGLGQYAALQWQIGYMLQLNQRWRLGTTYRGDWRHTNKTARWRQLQHYLFFGLKMHW